MFNRFHLGKIKKDTNNFILPKKLWNPTPIKMFLVFTYCSFSHLLSGSSLITSNIICPWWSSLIQTKLTHVSPLLCSIETPVICFALQKKWLLSWWNATLGWNRLTHFTTLHILSMQFRQIQQDQGIGWLEQEKWNCPNVFTINFTDFPPSNSLCFNC